MDTEAPGKYGAGENMSFAFKFLFVAEDDLELLIPPASSPSVLGL